MSAFYGKTQGDVLFVHRRSLMIGECNPVFAAEPLTLVSVVGNTITFADADGVQWVNSYDQPLGDQPEWVPFAKAAA